MIESHQNAYKSVMDGIQKVPEVFASGTFYWICAAGDFSNVPLSIPLRYPRIFQLIRSTYFFLLLITLQHKHCVLSHILR